MSSDLTVYVVEDDPLAQEVMRGVAESVATVECFDSAEACREYLPAAVRPDLFLLDVDLPGMDGYSYCRWLKDESSVRETPVIFVSAHDTIDARLTGYDAGGEDFICKPFDAQELLRKIKVARHFKVAQDGLKEQVVAAEQLSSLALASMDESGIVLQFMSKLIGWESETEIAEGLLQLLQRYSLVGAVQVRVGERTRTMSPRGVDLPLEMAILNHVRTLERIFELGNRSVHNFDQVTIMVENMPVHDSEQCGRIRDNLSIAAQGADARLAALATAEARARSQGGMITALQALQTLLMDFREIHQAHRHYSSELAFEFERDLARAFVSLGLTTEQERFLEDMIRLRLSNMMEFVDQGDELEAVLSSLLKDMATLH